MKKKRKQVGDERIYIPGHNHPFPDPSIPMPKIMKAQLYRKDARIQEYQLGGEIERFVKKAHKKPVMPKLIKKWIMNEEILKNPRKHTQII